MQKVAVSLIWIAVDLKKPLMQQKKVMLLYLVIGGTSMSLSGKGWGELAGKGAYPTMRRRI